MVQQNADSLHCRQCIGNRAQTGQAKDRGCQSQRRDTLEAPVGFADVAIRQAAFAVLDQASLTWKRFWPAFCSVQSRSLRRCPHRRRLQTATAYIALSTHTLAERAKVCVTHCSGRPSLISWRSCTHAQACWADHQVLGFSSQRRCESSAYDTEVEAKRQLLWW